MRKGFLLLSACFLLISCGGKANILFTDKEKNPLPQYNAHVPALRQYYPQEIAPIIIEEGDFHSFNYITRVVYLDIKNTPSQNLPPLAMHEASHIINYDISDGFSLEEQPRFIDEGMASIIYAAVAEGDIIPYRDIVINCKAKTRRAGGKAKLADLMQWKTYVGDYTNVENFYKTVNYEGYDEAASFVFFLTEKWGNDILYKIFKDLAATKDLNKTFKNILNKDAPQVETMWHAYIEQSVCKPKQ